MPLYPPAGGGTPATSVVSETTAGQSAAVGSSTNYARQDHTHGTPAGGAGSFSLTEVEVSLGSAPNARQSGKFSITTTGLTAGKNLHILQTNGPYTGKGTRADEAEMDQINVSGKTTSTTNIDCYWEAKHRVRGNYKFAYAVSA